jgi:hypothetical protein
MFFMYTRRIRLDAECPMENTRRRVFRVSLRERSRKYVKIFYSYVNILGLFSEIDPEDQNCIHKKQ